MSFQVTFKGIHSKIDLLEIVDGFSGGSATTAASCSAIWIGPGGLYDEEACPI